MSPRQVPVALALTAMTLLGAYSYYYTDTFTSINPANWTQNGVLSAGTGGLTSSDPSGGSLISNLAVPDGTSDYEVKTTLALSQSLFSQPAGTFSVYLHATSNALSGPAVRGTAYAFELQNVVYVAGNCSATLAGYKIVNGAVTTLFSSQTTCHNQMTLRAVVRGPTHELTLYVDDGVAWYGVDSTILAGKPGVGVRGASSSNRISSAQLGPLDRVAPTAIPPASVGIAAYSNHIDLQWPATTDDANGTGILAYQLYRDGVSLQRGPGRTFSDTHVMFSTTYTYQIAAIDYHLNVATTTVTATTPPAGNSQTRQVGLRATGTYWGGLGENIDMQSGNLNFSLPLLKAKGRGGWSVPFNLVYNSLNWRQDSGGTWKDGYDVGYGFGWKLLAGSIIPTSYGTPHYIFTDGSGAEYNLDQNINGTTLWTSKEGIYVTFDAYTSKLYFNDGSFWTFGCTSAGTEPDAGTMYPTGMQDSNGNQIAVRYYAGAGVGWSNSSARIQEIEDVRAVPQQLFPPSHFVTYSFTYDGSHRLQSIANTIGTSEGYTFSLTSGSLTSPFDSTAFGATSWLSTVSINGVSLSYQFATDSHGQLNTVVFPYGGYLRWDYTIYQYTAQRYQSEIQNRYLSKDGTTLSEKQYRITRDPADSSRTVHYWGDVWDPDNKSDKYWLFATSGTFTGLATDHVKRESPGMVQRSAESYTWSLTDSQFGPQQPYISSVLTTLEPGQSGQAQKKTEQTVGAYGNVTDIRQYDWNSLTTPSRSYHNDYLTDTAYTSRYIRNRVVQSQVTGGGQTVILANNVYDCFAGLCSLSNVSDPSRLYQHDSSYDLNFRTRGNLYTHTDPGGTQSYGFDITGNTVSSMVNGVATSGSYQASTNYAAPAAITTGSLTDNLQWSSFLGLTQETGPNGDSSATTYDNYARPASSRSSTGLLTCYDYGATTVTASIKSQCTAQTTPSRWTRTTLDGFGRTVKVEAGTGATTTTPLSITETTYEPCGCSPMGKTRTFSMPHANNATVYWTVYDYDGLGRTLSSTAPDGSIKRYAYWANTVTVTDEAGKWKKYVMDASGNLTQVTEPDPDNPATLTYLTTYGYDLLGHLTSVNMPRPTGTQTRTFNYGTPPGPFLLSATNPESGTVSYTYSSGRLASKTDAKNQQTQYSYDNYGRLSQIRHYRVAGGSEDVCAQVNLSYDSNPYATGFGSLAGRVAARKYQVCLTPSGAQPITTTFYDMFGYTPSGQVTLKRLRTERTFDEPYPNPAQTVSADLDASWSYDNEGRVTGVTYPTGWNVAGETLGGQAYTYGYDAMGRLNTMTNPGYTIVSGATYGPAGEVLTISGMLNESRTYNSRLQVTGFNGASYTYAAAPGNNGKILTETASGETVTYQYDSLNRLISGVSSGTWGQGFSYDGFGNLTGKSVLKGSAPYLSVGVDAATNRIAGYSYDANGNQLTTNTQGLGYDVENRVSGLNNLGANTGSSYGYDPDNRRVYTSDSTYDYGTGVTTISNEMVYFYGVTGQLMGSYQLAGGAGQPPNTNASLKMMWSADRVYFGGRFVGSTSGALSVSVAPPDRLGSKGQHYPYGEDRGAGGGMFGTYTRDAGGLDYAVNRYYASGLGRFMTPDPVGHATLTDPGTWNQFAYVSGDPINGTDPSGLCTVMIAGITMGPAPAPFTNDAIGMQAISAYPYQGQNMGAAIASVIQQNSRPNNATYAAYNAINYALASNDGTVDIIAYSGGAEAFKAAFNLLTPDQQARIGLVLYVSPGTVGGIVTLNGRTTIVEGEGLQDVLAMLGTAYPASVPVVSSKCAHDDFACLMTYALSIVNQMEKDGPCSDPRVFSRTDLGGAAGFGISTGGAARSPVGSGWSYWTPVTYGEGGVPQFGPGQWIWTPPAAGHQMQRL